MNKLQEQEYQNSRGANHAKSFTNELQKSFAQAKKSRWIVAKSCKDMRKAVEELKRVDK